MLFSTWSFLLFIISTVLIFSFVKSIKGKIITLLIFSIIFASWKNPLHAAILLWVIFFDYFLIKKINNSEKKRLWLYLSIINSISILAIFKYSLLILTSLNEILQLADASLRLPVINFQAPTGLSFFIFISMGYVIDSYYGRLQQEKNFAIHGLFVSFFAQISAGPIARASNLIPQLKSLSHLKKENLIIGFNLFVYGLFKKQALADYFALFSDKIFSNPANFSSGDLILGALAFTWQIYFDFSGYTDMARGVAKLFGIDLMENFRLPYMAASTGDFWSRWHISLSSWFRDYLYIPLGGNRIGRIKEIRNIMLTMILSGLWHGAAWNFLLWGSIHGVLHVASKLISSVKLISYIPLSIKRILIFIVIIFTWIFFKAETATDAFDFIYGIFSFNFKSTDIPPFMIALMIIAYIHHWLKEYRIIEFMERDIIKTILSCLMIFYIIFFCSGNLSDFIYFQF